MTKPRLTITILFALTPLLAQDAPKPVEPEYNRVAFFLNADGSLLPLERQQVNLNVKLKALGFGGAKSSASFKDSKSPVRFSVNQKLQFVVRLDTQGEDPTTFINLDVLTPTKDAREVVVAKVGTMAQTTKTTAGETLKSIDCSKYGEHSIRFAPSQKLPPGEYVITTKGSKEGFLFGVD